MMARNGNAFEGLLVLDLTRYMPGGFATQILADWGATVIKVEDTKRGDFCRYDPPTKHGISYYSTALCRNKKSISLDLKNKEANDCFQELSKKADIIIESFRPGVTKRLGIDYESIRQKNPNIIYASISAFGQEERTYVFPTVLRRSLLHFSVHNRARARQGIAVACAEAAQLCTIFLHRQKSRPDLSTATSKRQCR